MSKKIYYSKDLEIAFDSDTKQIQLNKNNNALCLTLEEVVGLVFIFQEIFKSQTNTGKVED